MDDRSERRDGLHEVLGRSLHAGSATATHAGTKSGGTHWARWWTLAVMAALLIGLAALGTPAQAQSSTESVFDKGRFLLGNLHEGGVTRPSGTVLKFANSFKTPRDDDFVKRLRSLHLAGGYGSGHTVSIHADSSGSPGTNLLTLRYAGRGSSVDGTNVYEFRTGWDGLKLAHNTTYWVVVDPPGTTATNYPTKSFTTSNSESQVGITGFADIKIWAIGDSHRETDADGVWGNAGSDAMRMELRGDSDPYFPVTKPPSPGIMVSNLEKIRSFSISVSGAIPELAQSFTTGGAGKLRSVRLRGGFTSAPRVSIYSDSSGAPGSRLRELLNPSALSATGRVHEFHAGKFDLALQASTTYWVVLEDDGSVPLTADNGESGATGWSIGNVAQGRGSAGWSELPSAVAGAFKIEILGFSNDPAPRVKGHASIGTQGTDCVWLPGETVDLTLRFNETVIVDTTDGTPSLTVKLSFRAARRASYASGSGTRSLLFSYTITSDDGQNSSMRVRRNGLRLNGGTIRNQSGTANADLRHRVASRGIPSNVPRGCQPEAGEAEWLVGNSTKGRGASDWTSGLRALSFTTGGSTATLKQALVFGSNWDSSSRVSVFSDSSGQPYLRLRTGRDHFHGGYGLYVTFDDQSLAANSTYWVAVEGAGVLKRLSNSGQDGPAGWSLGDRMLVYTGSAWRQHPSNGPMKIEVLGNLTAAAAAPTVSGAPTVDAPRSGVEWTPGATVIVKLTFSEAVTVDTTGGSPTVGISLGGTAARSAPYIRGSGTTQPWFAYTLTDADGTHGSIAVTANSLALNGGTIQSVTTSVDAVLSHAGITVSGARSQENEPKGSEKGSNREPANTPATGAPTISGTAQAGQTLTADTSGIADADGLDNASFSYQWIAGESDISGATSATYTLVDADKGKVIRVKVTFDDDSGNSEELTSEATGSVAPRPPLTASFESEPDSHDGNNTFTFEVRFSEEIYIGYKRLRDHVFTVTAGDVTRVRRLNPPSNTGWEVTVEPDGDGEVTIALLATKFCNRASAICTQNRKKLSNSSTITVPGPAIQSQQAEVENSPATGLPAITGTATVGNTLSVSMADVSDENGMTGASHSYQWMADDVNIQGATGATYTLADGDEGKAIKVKVSFTDADGFAESVTSAATAAVSAAPAAANSPATGLPTITGTTQVEQTLTADTSAIADEDGLSNVSYDYQWMAAGSNIDGATGSTYTLTASQQGQTIRVRVHFSDDSGNSETLTSAATVAVAAKPVPLTASFGNVPNSHDGNAAFTFELRFSEEFSISYKTLRDHAFAVTGGEVIKARRLERGKNVGWEITVRPAGDGTVTIVLPITTDCAADGTICTEDDRKLSNRLEMTVSGP